MIRPFHLAFPVTDLDEARTFYLEVMGCRPGRASERWQDLDFFGHQLVAHLVDDGSAEDSGANAVDGRSVPVPHFGVILSMDEWKSLADRLTKAGAEFVIEPYIRFEGEPGEQATMFLRDPSGNALEFKAFADETKIFAVD